VYISGEENIGESLRAAEDRRSREEDSGDGWKNDLLGLGLKVVVLHMSGLHRVPRRSRYFKQRLEGMHVNYIELIRTNNTEKHEFRKTTEYLVVHALAILEVKDPNRPWTSSFLCGHMIILRPHQRPG
jgi:hypothetical protein